MAAEAATADAALPAVAAARTSAPAADPPIAGADTPIISEAAAPLAAEMVRKATPEELVRERLTRGNTLFAKLVKQPRKVSSIFVINLRRATAYVPTIICMQIRNL